MSTGSVGKVRAVAEMFGAGGGASSSSERHVHTTDGDLTACRSSTSDAPKPPEECQSALRVELVPFVAAHPQPPPDSAGGDARASNTATNRCGAGLVWSGAACVKPNGASAPGTPCDGKSFDACKTACTGGSAPSCRLAAIVAKSDAEKAQGHDLMKAGCDLGEGSACTELAIDLPVRDSTTLADAIALLQHGCDIGDAWGCFYLAGMYVRSSPPYTQDFVKVAAYEQRACDLGFGAGCRELAQLYIDGKGVAKDPQRAEGLLTRACDGGKALPCERLGNAYVKGELGAADVPKGLAMLTRA
jgi:hypothetical protein